MSENPQLCAHCGKQSPYRHGLQPMVVAGYQGMVPVCSHACAHYYRQGMTMLHQEAWERNQVMSGVRRIQDRKIREAEERSRHPIFSDEFPVYPGEAEIFRRRHQEMENRIARMREEKERLQQELEVLRQDRQHYCSSNNKPVIYLRPTEWANLACIVIKDPDGWRRDGKDFHEPITYEEFTRRLNLSSIRGVGRTKG